MTEPDAFSNLSDDELLLALCVDKDQLNDPIQWCVELRAATTAMMAGPRTVEESEAISERFRLLRGAAAG